MRMKLYLLASILLAACGNPTAKGAPLAKRSAPVVASHGEVVKPPFAVRGDLEGLLLIWFDDKGAAHAASKRSEVPDAARARVRVDALELKPAQRLDPNWVYVADLRAAQASGDYRVEKWPREAFEASVLPPPPEAAPPRASDVILYGASWCGACKQAAQFLSQRGVPFLEKDIEKEPAARDELRKKAQAQGIETQSIPVIDARGTLMVGFDPDRLDALLSRPAP